MSNTIIIGTRGSKLALIQTEIVKNKLSAAYPQLTIKIKIISTKGDRDKKSSIPLDTVGKDWFSKELDNALLAGTIDIAVHSLKDIPEDFPKALTIAAIPEREDAREALVSYNQVLFKNLKKGAIVGTDSTRRKSQLLHIRPDLVVRSVRGNVDTRLEKVKNHEYDSLVLAVAGLKRLGLENSITEYFSERTIVPSPGQGALAVVVRKDNKKLRTLLKKITDKNASVAVKAERSFSKMFGGGCSMPIGAYATFKKEKITLYGMVASLDGKHVLKDSIKDSSLSPVTLGKTLGLQMMKKSSSWYNFIKKKYVIVTSPEKGNATNIKDLGLQPFFYPTIRITSAPITNEIKMHLENSNSFNWIVFTSKNGVRYFFKALKKLHIDLATLRNVQIAAVGEKTVEELSKNSVRSDFVPSVFTSSDLANQLQNVKGKKILLARGGFANQNLKKQLEQKSAQVIDLSLYKTELGNASNNKLTELLKNNLVQFITFTSPSTVKGFVKNIKDKRIYSIPVISIGPVTTKELKKQEFKTIYTADIFNEEGMLTKLKEILV